MSLPNFSNSAVGTKFEAWAISTPLVDAMRYFYRDTISITIDYDRSNPVTLESLPF